MYYMISEKLKGSIIPVLDASDDFKLLGQKSIFRLKIWKNHKINPEPDIDVNHEVIQSSIADD